MRKLITIIMLLMVLPTAYALEISSVEASTSQYSAMVSWQTDLEANSTVFYDINESMNKSVSDSEYVINHSKFISGLEKNTSYFYKILSCTNESDCSETEILFFVTLGEVTGNLTIELDESLKDVSQSLDYVIKGTSTPGAVIRVYINKEPGTEPDLIEQEDGTKVFALIIDSSGTFTGTIRLITGENTVHVEAEKGLEKIVVTKTILADLREPVLVLNQPESPTRNEIITVSGSVSETSNVSILIDNVSVDSFTIAGLFERENITLGSVSEGQEREFEIMLKAVDVANNKAFSEPKTVKVDKIRPDVDFETRFDESTHFTIFKIEGTTEPNAKVVAMNMGNYTTIQRYRETSASQILMIDPTGIILGRERTTTADSNGNFELRINLLEGLNNIFFNISDQAGNSFTRVRRQTLLLADMQWAISRIDAYPQNIFWEDIRSNEFEATAYIVFDWVESNETAPVNAQLDFARIENKNKANNDMIKELRRIKSYYDPTKAQLHALISVIINQWTGSPETLFERLSDTFLPTIGIEDRRINIEFEKFLVLDFRMQISENHVIDDSPITKTATSFGKVAYAIQKPEDLAKFLTPEMINTTLNDYIEPTIKFLQNQKENALIATGVGLLACGASIAYNYIAPLLGMDQWQPSIFWTCDRVLCPTVPPTCGEALTYVNPTRFFFNLPGGIRRNIVYLTNKEAGEQGITIDCASGHVERIYNSIEFESGGGTRIISDRDDRIGCADEISGINSDSVISENNPIAMQGRFFPTGQCYNSPPERHDETRCIYQSDKEPIDPTEGVWNAFRCACLPAMYGYISSALTVTQALEKCMQQAMVGETRAGFCERMLLIYACDLGIDLFRLILHDIPRASFNDRGTGWLADYSNSADDLRDTLGKRYGKGLVASRFGFSTEEIIHKGCLAAATGDIEIFQGALENVLRQTPVAPYGYVRGSSRQAGYDPFLGTMNINYNIYVGIVPGGITNVELKLVCDPNEEDGRYCPSEYQEILITRNLPRTITKDQLIDQNIELQSQAARYWFNKAVLTLEYNLEDPEGTPKIKVVTGKIKRHGDLAFGCRWSPITGITCRAITVDQFGTVELVKTGPVNTHISPDQHKTYYPKNKIALFTKLTTSYQDNFFLDFNIMSENSDFSKDFQYMIPATNVRDGEVRHYNFLVTQLGETAGIRYRSKVEKLELDEENENGYVKIYLDTDKQTTEVTVYGEVKGEERNAKCFASKKTENSKPTECDQEFNITKVQIPNALEKGTLVTVYNDKDGNTPIATLNAEFTSETTPIPEGEYLVEVDVLKDDNNDGKGDTPIPFDTKTQKTQFRFRVGNLPHCTEKPAVDIIEPVESYIPKEDSFNIGANIVDDCNNLESIDVNLRVEDGKTLCSCKVESEAGSYGFTRLSCTESTADDCTITFEKAPVDGDVRSGYLDVAPLYRFNVVQKSGFKDYENRNLEIVINAEAEGIKQSQIKKVRIKVPREGEIFTSDNANLNEIRPDMFPTRIREASVNDME